MKYSAQFVAALAATTVQAFPTSLEGQSFKITVVVADGFVMKVDDTSYEGYVIDMINMVADRANFTFDLKTPSGSGSQCDDSTNVDIDMYGSAFESQYLCGQDDVLDGNVPVDYQTDMYWSMYYVTPARQLAGKFSLPFKPPFDGLTMYGPVTSTTGIDNLNDLESMQEQFQFGPACVGENTAYSNFLNTTMPALNTIGVPNTDAGFLAALTAGTCAIAINAEHAALRFIKKRQSTETCDINGTAISIIGDGQRYGLTQMAIGFGDDFPDDTIRAINYWLGEIMDCGPLQCPVEGSLYGSWLEWAGTGDECDVSSTSGTAAASSGLVCAAAMFVSVFSFMMM